MGAAFRATFDKPMYEALAKAGIIERGEHMVRSFRGGYHGDTTFKVRVCRHNGRELSVYRSLSIRETELADEAIFSSLGTSMATEANEELEPLYMAMD